MENLVKSEIKRSQDLIKSGHEKDGLLILENLCGKYPSSGDIWLKYALALDGLSKEELAIPNYQKALQLHLDTNQEKVALICLASSFRNVNKIDEALKIIRLALMKYPNNTAVECFYSLILLDSHQASKALKILGLAMLKNANPNLFEGFKDALHEKFTDLTD